MFERSFFDLHGKRGLVTGAASGIGRAVATRLRDAGAETVFSDLHDQPPADLSDVDYRVLDVTDEAACAALAEELSGAGLDILVNNAGIALEEGYLGESDLEAVRQTIDVNLLGVFHCMKHFAPLVRDGGSIINTASASATVGVPGYGGYAATKAALVSLTRVAAMELGEAGVRVNAVCPGTIDTPMEDGDSEEARFTRRAAALGRIGQTDDLVGLYHFLASDEARFISGQAIYVDGGLTAGAPAALIDAAGR